MPPSETGRSSRYAESRVVLAPSRSWTLAASTTTTMSRPKVSVTMNRFLPLICVPSHRTWPGSTSLTCGGPDSLRRHSAGCLTEVGPRWPFSRLMFPGDLRPFHDVTTDLAGADAACRLGHG